MAFEFEEAGAGPGAVCDAVGSGRGGGAAAVECDAPAALVEAAVVVGGRP